MVLSRPIGTVSIICTCEFILRYLCQFYYFSLILALFWIDTFLSPTSFLHCLNAFERLYYRKGLFDHC